MKKIGVIGCGARAACYMRQLKDGMGTEWKVTCLADPRALALETYKKSYTGEDARTYGSGPELLAAEADGLDAVVIASPNALHLESVLPALKAGLTMVLEKPIATTEEDCRAMWQAYVEAGRPSLAVGFVLRYTNFYGRIRQLIESGAVGDILSIEADELLGPSLTATYMRGWRRKHDISGPFLLEKCSHDMDLLNWFVGAPAARVSSFASRTVFAPKPGAALTCRACALRETCRYAVDKIAPYLMDLRPEYLQEIGALIPKENDLCVYNSDKDIPDHQVVNIAYANGVLATFSLCTDQPRTTRTLRINGTKAQIWGDIGRDLLRVEYHPARKHDEMRVEEVEIAHDGSGHHGGDSVIGDQFKAMLRGQPTPPLAGMREGVNACLVSLAAHRSAETGEPVNPRFVE
ncbi:MAG: Gfo/Idh/MocA family oxidoreductase [Candidatus Marinimicrobia bacterium]|nr:Gfo/Idh/MocA family oxidoreductase [Candidatus Neomarinimicrobiota bacterium]